ncbi:hypothetical protein GC087_21330 [Pantoea sp. JZ2]|uniref:hypothetical protein n=1 Tax=Pantoea sp. JZ2 TaxID=2654189 RepID=UPI002B486350|nr:hypothetical protein [Pantoea sp. JZ2]WRH14960.1 hypothetical protein GC087_21330 [Pantoea sp. JZ2]
MEKKTRFIGGVEVDADIARTILNDVLPVVASVTEKTIMSGASTATVVFRAKLAAETVVSVIADLLKEKAKA